MKRAEWGCISLMAMTLAFPAAAAPVRDCPLRDVKFSLDSPLIDILLSQKAKAIASEGMGGKLNNLPPTFASTKAPTFAAILTLRNAAAFMGVRPEDLGTTDAKLRALPVTEADRTARCERYDNTPPALNLPAGKPHLLLFEKITGFKDIPGFEAAHKMFLDMARQKGWNITVTDKAGAFTPDILRKFDAVIWNNISGDVLTLSQRKAFRSYIENGGSYIGVHGSAGDPSYFWDWYADTLLGARFTGHTLEPQFQDAKIIVAPDHPVSAKLPSSWTMKDEWYSFAQSPRQSGADVVATLDESTYSQAGHFGQKLSMGDHPIAWTRKIGKGRMFYSAIGHLPQSYENPQYMTMLENAVVWATAQGSSRKANR